MSDPNTFEALIERWSEPSGDLAVKLCADELAALAPHYIHKDKLRELRDKWLAYSNTAELSRASCWHACATALTALLEQP